MSVMTPDTKDEQDKAYDPARETYDRKFNEIISGAQTASDLKERESSAGNSDDFKKWEDEMSSKSGSGGGKPPTGNIDSAKSGEEDGGWQNNTSGKPARGEKLGALLKKGMTKKGPIGILAAILFGGGGALGFFGFTLMPVTIMEHFTNDLNDLNSSNQRKVIDLFGKKLGGNDMQKKLSVCNAMISIRCSLDSIPESLAKKLEEDGKFKLGDKTVKDGRVSFSSITSPDGIVATNVQELQAMMRNSAVAAAAFNAVYSIKNSIFLLGSFFKNALAKLNLTKNKKIEGDNKKAVDESYEKSVKGEKGTVSTSAVKDNPGDDASEEAKRKAGEANAGANEIETEVNKAIAGGTKIQKLSLKLTNALAVPQLMCLTYNMATFIAVAAKTKKLLRFAGFAMIFLTLASSIKAQAATDPEVEKGMSVLAPGTYPAYVEDENNNLVPNPAIGQNALDAEAYKVVAYGDMINLTGIAMKFFVAGGIVGVIEKVLRWVNDNMGRENVKLACKVVNHTIATVISFLAAPVISAVMYGIVSILPVEEWAADLVNLAIEAAAGGEIDVIGKDAGNVLFVGAAAIMGTSAQRFGMKPGALAGIKKNMSDNNELLKQEIALKTHEAAKTPFDITNRYSFLGSLSYQLASFMPSLQSPVFSSIGKIIGAIPNSLNMVTKNANAAYSMPVQNYSDTRFNQCKDDVYSTLPITPDMFCTIRYTPYQVDANKLAKEINPDNPSSVQLAQSGVVNYVSAQTAVTYMQDTTKQANEDGTPVAGTHYDKFTKNCVERTDPPGSSSKPLEEQATGEDGRWEKGEACMDDTPQNLLASEYTGYKESIGVMENKGTTTQVAEIGEGDARSLAQQVANNSDIVLLNNNTKISLESFSNTGTATNVCGAPFTPDPALLKTMLTLTNKYKIYVNNIGFGEPNRDREARLCDAGQHPKGAAIDINRIDIKGGASTGMGLTFSGAQIPIITAYANDWLVALAPGRGGVGQAGCGFTVTPPPGATGINGNLHFADACNHLHIDARTR